MKKEPDAASSLPWIEKWFVGKEALWLIVGERYDSRRRTRF